MIVILVAIIFKMRGLFKKILPLLEDFGDFTVYLVICGVMLFSAVSVAGFIRDHNDQISEMFAKARERCEPPRDERSIEQFIHDELEKIKQPNKY